MKEEVMKYQDSTMRGHLISTQLCQHHGWKEKHYFKLTMAVHMLQLQEFSWLLKRCWVEDSLTGHLTHVRPPRNVRLNIE